MKWDVSQWVENWDIFFFLGRRGYDNINELSGLTILYYAIRIRFGFLILNYYYCKPK